MRACFPSGHRSRKLNLSALPVAEPKSKSRGLVNIPRYIVSYEPINYRLRRDVSGEYDSNESNRICYSFQATCFLEKIVQDKD